MRVLARAIAACAGLVTLAALGVVATIFGFGWAVFAIAAVALIGVLAAWPRLGPGWALLPIVAMAVPSVAVAARGWQLAPETGHMRLAPRALTAGLHTEYRNGLGTMLVDLRRTAFPASGTVSLRIDGGVRRTAYKQIAARLGISVRTVESHVGAVLRKLQLSSRHEVTHWRFREASSTTASD